MSEKEPIRTTYSRNEMIEHAKKYMRENFGPANCSREQDRWHERFGMLVDFICDIFPIESGLE